MRLLALGDIHGCYTALTTVMEAAGLTADDRLVTLGDYVDRGPDSCAVLDWLVERHTRGQLAAALLGNHEMMMLAARENYTQFEDWLRNGGDATLASYGPGADLDNIPKAHWDFLCHTCCKYYQNRTHFFVHGNVIPEAPLEEQPDFMLLWEKFHEPPPHQSGKTMVCGHTPQRTGIPRSLGHAICIDTWVYRNGWLTCLDVASGRYWQGNEEGESRTGWLEEG